MDEDQPVLRFAKEAHTSGPNERADAAMRQLWKEWFRFYNEHFRPPGIAISGADQMAFYEIAQPIMRKLAAQDLRYARQDN